MTDDTLIVLIFWEFKCLDCSYIFKKISTRKDFESCNKCLHCDSKNIIKQEL